MSTFYEKYVALCAQNEKTPSGAAVEMGLSKGTANGWKVGKRPNDLTLAKLAAYFGVPVSYFNEESDSDLPVISLPATKTAADMEQLFTVATDEQKIEWAARLISSLSDNQQAALIQRIMFKK